METLEDIIRHILDYDSEETVALTFKTKARLVRNIVSEVEQYFKTKIEQPSAPVSGEEILQSFRKFFNERYNKCAEAWKIEILNIDIKDFLKNDIALQSQSKPEHSSTEPRKSIDEILSKYQRTDEGNGFYDKDVWEAMEEYRNQPDSKKRVTDEEIKEYANGLANHVSRRAFERGEWLGILEGAKAMRDGKIGLIKGK